MSSGKLECDDAAIKCLFERGMLNGLLRMERTLELRSRRGSRVWVVEVLLYKRSRCEPTFCCTIVAYHSELPARIYR
jgi:hypothetical protein